MSDAHPLYRCGYISLTMRGGSPVLVRASRITHIHTLGNGGMTVINFDNSSITVMESNAEVIERIDAYIAPDMR